MNVSSFLKKFENAKARVSWRRSPFKDLKAKSLATKCDTGKSAEESKDSSVGEMVEMATKALKSNRLFYHAGNNTSSSILDQAEVEVETAAAAAAKYEFNYFKDMATKCDTGKSAEESRDSSVGEKVEMATKALKSNRLFHHAGSNTSSSILDQAEVEVETAAAAAKYEFNYFKDCVSLAMDSENPYWDFRKSMEEMRYAYHGVKRWEHLEELLALYLRLNRKNNHGLIVAAFLDIFATISTSSSLSSSFSSSSSKNQRLVRDRVTLNAKFGSAKASPQTLLPINLNFDRRSR